jgi:membrane-bound serine protease (ClpP class)
MRTPGTTAIFAALRAAALGIAALFAGSVFASSPAAPGGAPPRVVLATIDGVISPAANMYLRRAIRFASASSAEAIVLQLDTPGGLLQSTEEMMKAILASPVPVVVYVAPQGGRAASAGVFLLYSAHIAAMAPTTNVGAATPVTTSAEPDNDNQRTLRRKVTNDAVARVRAIAARRGRNAEWAERAVRDAASITADQAVAMRVADLVARDVSDLLAKINGRAVELPAGVRALRTLNGMTVPFHQDARERFLGFLAHPNVGLVLMTVAIYGIVFELQNPGAIFPGIAGAIALLLAFASFSVLDVNLAGVALIGFAIALFIIELFVPGFGLLAGGGIVSFILGAVLLTSDHEPYFRTSIELAALIAVTTAAFFGLAVRSGLRAQRGRPKTGAAALVGEIGIAQSDLSPFGTIHVRGEQWSAEAVEGPVAHGDRVRVVDVVGLRLRVRGEPPR